MGFISRRVLPACGSMCVCCPALRSRSRQPVKRYKKLLADIFPKAIDAPLSDRKITKLGEYAAKNPIRIPKIVKYLEQRSSKELRSEHVKFITIIMEAYNKLLCLCKDQMAYFAVSLVSVITELLESTQKDGIRMLACQTLTRFIYCQADGTYTHNIENLVPKVCALACESGEGHEKLCLRASALQCLSAVVWFMSQFSHIFSDFDEIVKATLDNYGVDAEEDDERGESHHNWVDEVMRCEARGDAGIASDVNPVNLPLRPRLEKKDPSMLTREEIETPTLWAQICIQNMIELAKESSTMRRVLDPMLIYFDKGRHWELRHGLALHVLSDVSYLVEDSGNEQLILAAVIRHLDHKNVAHDPQIKSNIVQIATALTHQLRSQGVVAEIGVVSDLCRHLRKSLQAAVESVGQQESNWNITLQKSIEDCLLEIAKGVGDARPLFDMMALTLEKLPAVGVATRAIIGSLLILAHIISLASVNSQSMQDFPEALLMQLLKSMAHPDVETRIGAHWIFATLLVPTSEPSRHEGLNEPRRWQSKTASTSASVTALLEKLRREKECVNAEMHGDIVHDDHRERDVSEEEWKHGWARRRSPNFYKINYSIFDWKAGVTHLADEELTIMKLTEDQIVQLLSAFWVQANLPDNLPSNFEAIAHSFSLTLLASHLKNTNHGMIMRFFQLPLSLRNVSLNLSGRLPPSRQRSLYSLATAMLLFASKSYQILDLIDLLRSSVSYDVDPYLHIGDDMQLYYKSQTDLREYGSTADEEAAVSLLSELRIIVRESEKALLDILTENLSILTEMDKDDLAKQLSVTFIPDDTFLFSPQSVLKLDHFQAFSLSKGSISFDEDSPPSPSVEDDVVSELSAGDLPRFLSKVPISPSLSQILSVGQLLESALEVAGQVAASSISTTPVPYSAMASHCEALGTGTRKKLSTWLGNDSRAEKLLLTLPASAQLPMRRINYSLPEEGPAEPWATLRLPPASPFDNFLKAAGC
ncbi:protein SEMI-ROLLED LEAF 2 [Aristolochia californica]|uniref:protein SEMI-ROLLED LEAF 2 n=1 Tax=Aristolochia californica TaxID=171875 RepID=UPI0035E1EB6E